MLPNETIRQMAYCVPDVREFAAQHRALFGSGPFFLAENSRQTVTFLGEETLFCTTAAFGQWGDVQIEIMQSLPDGPPNILDELYPRGSGRFGLHHVAFIVDDFGSSVATLENAGFDVALRAHIEAVDAPSVMVDAVERLGHYIEIYPGVPGMIEFYDMVEEAARNYKGGDLFTKIEL